MAAHAGASMPDVAGTYPMQLYAPFERAMRGGERIVALAVHQKTPRNWTEEDVALAEEAAGRAWAEVERSRAEAALRESEARFRAPAVWRNDDLDRGRPPVGTNRARRSLREG